MSTNKLRKEFADIVEYLKHPDNNKIVIGVSGKMCSGKSTVMRIIKKMYGKDCSVIETSKFVRMIWKDLKKYVPIEVETNRRLLQEIGSFMRTISTKTFIYNVFQKFVMKRNPSSLWKRLSKNDRVWQFEKYLYDTKKAVLLVGIRAKEEAEAIFEVGGYVINIDADDDVVLERFLKRGRNSDNVLDEEKIRQALEWENNINKDLTEYLFDDKNTSRSFRIYNNNISRVQLRKYIESFLSGIDYK